MRLLVTGGGGQLSRCIVAEASALAPEIALTVLDRAALDLTDGAALRDGVARAAPDLVVNAAAYTAVDAAEDEPEQAMTVNGEGAGLLAEAAQAAGARLIHLSTDYVFDGRATRPYREQDETAPQGAYGRSKREGERRTRIAAPEALILRTAWVYSPYGRNFVRSILAAAGQRDRLTVVEDQVGSPTSALDLARALLRIAARPAETWQGGLYHLAGDGIASWFDVAVQAMATARALGLPTAEVAPIRSDQWPAKAPRPAYSVLDTSRFRTDFGFALRDWRPAVIETVERIAGDGAAS